MSSNAKRLPEVNLEDFERRLRAAGSTQGVVEDPLEELTRLVNTISTERTQPESRAADALQVRAPTPMRPANLDDEPEYAPLAREPEPLEDVFDLEDTAHQAAEPPLLRRSIDEADFQDVAPPASIRPEPQYPETEASARKPSWYLKIGGFGAIALVMAAGAAYLKLHDSRIAAGGAPPMIMAAAGPSKVAPPDETNVRSPSDSGALLTKDSTAAGGVKIVSHQEQPIDLSLKGDSPVAPTKDSPIIPPGLGVAMVQPASPGADAQATEPAPNPPDAAPIVQRKGPKVVSVRPDGTLITADTAPASPPPAVVPPPSPAPLPSRSDSGPAVTTQPASPTLDLPPKPAKTTTRVNVAKTDTTGPTEPVSAPLQLGSAGSGAAADKTRKLPTKLRPPEIADAQPATVAPSGGDWAVQLAAPRSEADAQSAIQKLQTKFASSLGDNNLVVRKAEVNGEKIYRVRAVGLTKADAVALCQRLKSDGGDCFPTRN